MVCQSFFKVSSFLFIALSSLAFSALAQNPSQPSKALNPDIGVDFLGTYKNTNKSGGEKGFHFQEAELQLSSDVDAYFKAKALFSISPSEKITGVTLSGPDLDVEKERSYNFEPEELFIETTSLEDFTIKFGKFKTLASKHNTLHTHAYPFIDGPLINEDLLGHEGLNDVGVSVAALIPAPWFVELTAQSVQPSNDILFHKESSENLASLVHLKNFWDFSDSANLEFSLFAAQGENNSNKTAEVQGLDLIFKWKPTEGGMYQSLTFANQYLLGKNPGRQFEIEGTKGDEYAGLASWLQYQFARRWWVKARSEHTGITKSEGLPSRYKQSALLGFFPSEYSGLRLQYDQLSKDNSNPEYNITLQWNMSFGAPPAHSY